MTQYTQKDIEVVSHILIDYFIDLLGDDYEILVQYRFSKIEENLGYICIKIGGNKQQVRRRYYTIHKDSIYPNYTFVGKLIENTFRKHVAMKKNYARALKQELVERINNGPRG